MRKYHFGVPNGALLTSAEPGVARWLAGWRQRDWGALGATHRAFCRRVRWPFAVGPAALESSGSPLQNLGGATAAACREILAVSKTAAARFRQRTAIFDRRVWSTLNSDDLDFGAKSFVSSS